MVIRYFTYIVNALKYQHKTVQPRHLRNITVVGTLLSAAMVWLAADVLRPMAPLLGLFVRW